eukprot:GCRY01001168.1.p1 GENE.GCRY01001168.1~~GCRY01001168.1.p1  ORF type:complete len:528 (+),score=162.49 GCRY01001168.1:94-1677(+)
MSSAVKVALSKKQSYKRKLHHGAPRNQPPEDSYDSDTSIEEGMSDIDGEDLKDYRVGGYHPVYEGEVYSDRYKILRRLGWGHFSTVWLATDLRTEKLVALKVIKSARHYTDAALDELEMLKIIRQRDPNDDCCCVQLLDDFKVEGPNGVHVVMVFEVLGRHMLSLIKASSYKGLPLPVVRNICKQVLIALDFIHQKAGLIHTDLKPENVLLADFDENLLPPGKKPKLAEPAPLSLEAKKVEGTLSKNAKKRLKAKQKKQAKKTGDAAVLESEGVHMSEQDKEHILSGTQKMEIRESTNQQENAENIECPEVEMASPDTEQAERHHNSVAANEPHTAGSGMKRIDSLALLDEKINTQNFSVKLADFGNACYVDRHFTEDIQTRQYRAPEVILGNSYDTAADMWSMACMAFELATGDLLFQPKGGREYSKEDDHLAQIIELLGTMPSAVWRPGKFSRDFFNRRGDLRNIKRLHYWELQAVLMEKYKWNEEDARVFCDFLLPMLRYRPEQRATAADALRSEFITGQPRAN